MPRSGSKNSLTVNKFEITSNTTGVTFDISKGDPDNGVPGKTPVISYRESVFVPFVEIQTVLVDEGTAIPEDGGFTNVMSGLKIEGAEKVSFQITDGAGNTIRLTGSNDLRLNKPGQTFHSRKSMTTALTIVSKEALDNTLLENEVTQKLEGKISEAVRRILRNDLKSNKSLLTDETQNKVENAFGCATNPFEMIKTLQIYAIPEGVSSSGGGSSSGGQNKCAGYLFWQTSDGIHFKSLHKIFEGTPTHKFIFNNKVDDIIPEGYDDKILEAQIDSSVDVMSNLERGTYKTEMHIFDENTQEYTTDGGLETPTSGNGRIAGRNLPISGSEYFNKATKRLSSEVPYGGFELGESLEQQKEKTTQPAFNPDQIAQQSMQGFRQKFTVSGEIIVPCNLALHAGTLIQCDLPGFDQKRTPRKNTRSSGIYMISDLCHYTSASQAYTKLRIVRDSFGIRV